MAGRRRSERGGALLLVADVVQVVSALSDPDGNTGVICLPLHCHRFPDSASNAVVAREWAGCG
ncbi:hypothetical protein HMPREF1550_00417 [Actinomyces sp. oral taxon 877 str. F0543]|nr:hypothetical protein HMPREF1550_00417 [Actinomyces sp. oral taxon 877 str. F0543]